MLVYNNADFEAQRQDFDAKPTIQIVAKGAILDTEMNEHFLVEATTIRVNHVILNEWLNTNPMLCDPPEDFGLSREEYNQRLAERQKRRKKLEDQVAADLRIDRAQGSFAMERIVAEFFTIVTMRKEAEIP